MTPNQVASELERRLLWLKSRAQERGIDARASQHEYREISALAYAIRLVREQADLNVVRLEDWKMRKRFER